MSKIGKRPIPIPDGVKIEIKDDEVKVIGPKGTLTQKIHAEVKFELKEKELQVDRGGVENKENKSNHGLYRSLINNMVIGTSTGFTQKLLLSGTGYRAKMSGKKLELSLGFSHPVLLDVPEGIECKLEGQTTIILSSIDKQKLGQFAANIRKIRPPEPYKGKGIKYEGEHVRRKAGKAGK